jgi:peroxiredoxin (alkyl hydroperoxide reductase subunit C)
MAIVGKKAPIFQAPAVMNGRDVIQDFSLAQFIDKKEVVFFFYPKDFTFVCPTELIAFQNALHDFEKRGVAVVGCSTDTEETHLAWLKTPRTQGGIMGVTYPLVADVAKTIAANYGVLAGNWEHEEDGNLGFVGAPVAYRGTFFIDKQGVVRHESVNELSLGRNIAEFLRIVDMWHHIEKHGEVCPANWTMGQEAMRATATGVADYLTKNMNN